MEKKKFRISTKDLVIMAVLIAVEIVLSRFLSISAWNTKIGFAFVPVVIAAVLLGPVYAGIVGAVADLLGAVLFPIGAYFPGFTLTAFLTGLVYGLFLHKEQTIPRVIGAVAINQGILSLFLNTFWISVLYGSPFKPLLITRLPQTGILTVVQIVVIIVIAKVIPRIKKEVF
ncbi:MAG: folate family ECF transporter S component [Firmicutes bacterium]|nr:folate family ECF transporter S component [Bacillota bacterium]